MVSDGKRCILGIDPGLSGAIALFNPETGSLDVVDVPTLEVTRNGKARRIIDNAGLKILVKRWVPSAAAAFMEQVNAGVFGAKKSGMSMGVSSAFNFGRSVGALEQVLADFDIPVFPVPPQTWKKSVGIETGSGKDKSREVASRLLPQHAGFWRRVKDQGRSEAALIAFHGAKVHADIGVASPAQISAAREIGRRAGSKGLARIGPYDIARLNRAWLEGWDESAADLVTVTI